jgi:hypothetical protein
MDGATEQNNVYQRNNENFFKKAFRAVLKHSKIISKQNPPPGEFLFCNFFVVLYYSPYYPSKQGIE